MLPGDPYVRVTSMDNGATSRLSMSMANSPARKRKKSAVVQDSYHHIASTFFSLGKGNTTDLAFLEAARVSELKVICPKEITSGIRE